MIVTTCKTENNYAATKYQSVCGRLAFHDLQTSAHLPQSILASPGHTLHVAEYTCVLPTTIDSDY
jgi:hypothetical protein